MDLDSSFLDRDLSQTFNRARYKNKTKFRLVLWLKQSKHTLGYGFTNIHESQNSLQVKFHEGKVAIGYSHNVIGMVINNKE